MVSDMRGYPSIKPTQYDYVERTTNLTVTPTTTATAADWIVGNPVAYDGQTRIIIDSWIGLGQISVGAFLFVNLWDNGVDLGYLLNLSDSAGTLTTGPLYGRRFLTPSNGVHTYTIKASKSGGTATLFAATGIVDTMQPAWLRITPA